MVEAAAAQYQLRAGPLAGEWRAPKIGDHSGRLSRKLLSSGWAPQPSLLSPIKQNSSYSTIIKSYIDSPEAEPRIHRQTSHIQRARALYGRLTVRRPRAVHFVAWQLTPVGRWKLNIDGSVNKGLQLGFRCLFRDNIGQRCGAFQQSLGYYLTSMVFFVTTMIALGLGAGVQANDSGFGEVGKLSWFTFHDFSKKSKDYWLNHGRLV
ncbi:hypothetical protein Ancab_033615 [Ancistrocladus abbreviatus]